MIGAMSRITKATSASGSAAGVSSDAVAPPGADFREQPLRIERRNIRRKIGNGEREIAGDANERAHANDLVVADAVDGGNADDLARERRLFRGRQPIAFVRAFFGAAAERAAQRDFDAFGQRRKIGFAVERRENGAAHESSAA